jgi:hypothetical protein
MFVNFRNSSDNSIQVVVVVVEVVVLSKKMLKEICDDKAV